MFNLFDNTNPIIADKEPLTIPQISPITSLHIEDILLPFFIKYTPSFAPLIFFVLLAWNVDSSAVNTAVPIISKIIPIIMNKIVIIVNTIKLLNLFVITFENVLKNSAIIFFHFFS